jgi:hypothetical protein
VTFVAVLLIVTAHAARADVVIRGATSCFSPEALRQKLARFEAAAPGVRVDIALRDVQSQPDTALQETVIDVVAVASQRTLDRTYRIQPSECGSAIGLVEAVLARFLEELPAEDWKEKPTPQPEPAAAAIEQRAPVAPQPAIYSVVAHGDLAAAFASANAELGLGAALERDRPGGMRLRLSGALRSGLAQPLGDGEFRTFAGMLGAGAGIGQVWRAHAEARIGAINIAGSEFARSFSSWLVWTEAELAAERRFGALRLGVFFAASPLRHRARADNAVRTVSRMRLGVRLSREF